MIRIVEVGPRDGLQNEKLPVPTEIKLQFILGLINSGITEIEATSFVSPKWVPQLGDAVELWQQLPRNAQFSALVPNVKGLERALECGVDRIAIFTAASDDFTLKNINMTVDQSLDVFSEVVSSFRQSRENGFVRGYVSTAFECPYRGRIKPAAVIRVIKRLAEIGVDEISIGDTIGVAVPSEVRELSVALREDSDFPLSKIAWHFHDTRGTAIANVGEALEFSDQFRIFDSSAAGLGGCPYAKGAGGNLATEDLVYFLERTGMRTGIDLDVLSRASLPVLTQLGKVPFAKAQQAFLAEEN